VIIDTHFHLWDPAARKHAWLDRLPALNRPFGLADFERASRPEGVTASVLVQVLASTAETEEFLALAGGGGTLGGGPGAGRGGPGAGGTGQGAGGTVAGVVGWVDLASPAAADEIARLRELPGGSRLVGMRHLVQDERDPDWLLRPGVRRGLRAVGAAGLAYDLLVRPAQLPAALAVTGDFGDVRFVLDHGAKPDIASGSLEPWASLIGELAARPNAYCKVSGLVTEAGADWRPAQIAPYVDHLLNCFGPARLIFGSDWPVCTLAADYGEVVALARETLGRRLGPAEIDAVFAANAVAAYRLGLASRPSGAGHGGGISSQPVVRRPGGSE
jgi:L-fucono-1,5-lactonase